MKPNFFPGARKEQLEQFDRLLTIMKELRELCPWDREQTFESLRTLTIEETYELADAILDNDLEELKGEIGDIMLHMVFYSKIASEKNAFDITDVLNAICDKLVHRHPHIYGDTVAEDEATVKANWEKLKLKEGKTSFLQGVPRSLPSLVKAARIQEKVKGIGFDWDNSQQVLDKVHEELGELNEEVENKTDKIEEEFGDVLFSMINYARFVGVNPETALERTNKKFIRRFQEMEKEIQQEGKSFDDMNLEQMDQYWEKAKSTVG